MQVLTSASHTEPLRWKEIPDPKLLPDDVRVTVRAAGVNPVDWKMRQGDLLGMVQSIIGPPGTLDKSIEPCHLFGDQPSLGFVGVLGRPNNLDHAVDLDHREPETFDDLPPLARLGQIVQ